MSKVCAFTAVCKEDERWVDQYLREVDRLQIPFVALFDRCWFDRMSMHPLCVGGNSRAVADGEFTEQCKQSILDVVQGLGYEWAMAWDIDETYENGAAFHIWKALDQADKLTDWIDVRWLNLWDTPDHIRVDLNFAAGHRVKFYRMREGLRWVFDHPITNGPKLMSGNNPSFTTGAKSPLVCLHWGMMTAELRRQHKERWDRIYSMALRGDPNPYGFWKQAIETEHQAVTIKHGY